MRLIIKDKNGDKLNQQELDIDIAKLWNKEFSLRYYATPTPEFTNPDNLSGVELTKAQWKYMSEERNNWYDFIKYTTDTFLEGKIEYEDLMNRMFTPIRREDSLFIINCEFQMKYNEPYFDVLEMWYEKGYTIHNIL